MNGEAIGDMLSFVIHASYDTLTDLVEVRLHLEVAAAEIAARTIGNAALGLINPFTRGLQEIIERRRNIRRVRPRISPASGQGCRQ